MIMEIEQIATYREYLKSLSTDTLVWMRETETSDLRRQAIEAEIERRKDSPKAVRIF